MMSEELDLAIADYWNAETVSAFRDAYARMRAAGAPPAYGEEVKPGEKIVRLEDQPPQVSFEMVDGIAVVSTKFAHAGTYMPQHSHKFAHISVLATGKVAIWKDGQYFDTFTAPKQIVIDANVKHLFQALTDDVLILCVHNVSRTGEIEISEEHQIV